MKIKEISIQNFYSICDLTLNFEEYKGLIVIKGKNVDSGGSNGSGKSALIEAICFGLTGKTIRKSTEDALVNNIAKKKCKVTLSLEAGGKDIKVIRQKKPSKLQVFDGENEITEATQALTQQSLNNLLNTNYKVLMASMFFGQSNDINFLDCSADDKRNIIRHFLNLGEMFRMRDKIKLLKSNFYQLSKRQEAIINEHLGNINNLEGKIKSVETFQQIYEDDYSQEELNLTLEDVVKMEDSFKKWKSVMKLYQKDIDHHHNKLKKLEKSLNKKVCDTCGSKLTIDVDKIEKMNSTILGDLKKIENKIDGMPEPPFPPISVGEYSKIEEYRSLKKEFHNYSELIGEAHYRIEEAESVKHDNDKLYEVMRFWEKAFSEHGLIKYIIKNILDYFNERTNYYLSYLSDNKIFLTFDQELNETISTNESVVQYISLSGGEKRKVNLAVLLALKDLLLLTDTEQSNLLFFDEVAENLDEEGVNGLYQLLQQIKQDKTVFVVTHNKHLKTLLDSSKRISIMKHEGKTTLGK